MDNHRIEDEDRNALAGLSSIPPPPRKIHSYSQQLRGSTDPHHRRHNQVRKHSLDDDRIIPHAISVGTSPATTTVAEHLYQSSSDDDEFFPSTSNTSIIINSNSSNNNNNNQHLYNGPDYAADPRQPASNDPPPLPEFIAGGGGTGIFKVPKRAAVHPTRPLCNELRPHPLKETQVGKFLRNIACTNTQLWAGQESGVRFWNFDNIYEPGWGLRGRIRRGDEDAAPFQESVSTSPTLCLLVDSGNKLVWSGHKDGKIRSWKMDQPVDTGSEETSFKEGLSWQAHRGPVLSMVFSSYGDLWSGHEGGIIKVWPWETIEKSLSLRSEEKHMAALLVERSFVDIKAQVTVNGVSSISSGDVKCLLSDKVRAKVWAASSMSFSLWNALTRELLKVFNIEGQMENRVDVSNPSDPAVDQDEMKVKFVSKKEKPQGFLQRSRNAILGAADAVRRVATKGAGAFVDDTKKTEALVLTVDGMIWSGCSNGLLVQWDGSGNRLRDFNHHSSAVLCFCTLGTRIYVGYLSGLVHVLDLDGNVIAGWIAHSSPVITMAVGEGYIYSLATHGGIRAWNIASPGPIDNIIRAELTTKEQIYRRRDNVKILVGTWNVGQGKPNQAALTSWLGSVASDVGIIVVGCQEVEMGAGFLAMSAAKETVGLEGSAIGNCWLDTIGKSLDEGNTFERMGSRQLAGLLIAIWVRKNLRTHVGDVDVGAVPCGFGRAIGNKGGVGLRIRVFDRIMCFVNCHLAAHLEAVNRRNADFDHVYRNLTFSRSYNVISAATAGVSTTAQLPRGTSNSNSNSEDTRPDLAEADMIVFLGDFNYRLFGISYDEARDFVSQRSFDWLREKDQLRAEMQAGRVFQGMREALIRFPPTYKFERHKPGLAGYDSGEKKRIPAWCDRILYRDNRSASVSDCSLDCPAVASILLYEACMDVTESDHKPVRCKFSVEIAHVDRSVRRQELGNIMKSNERIKSMLAELRNVPQIVVSTESIVLKNQETSILRITNRCMKDKAVFRFICEGQSTFKDGAQEPECRPRAAFGLPRWLEVTPSAGIINPDQFMDITIHHEENHTLEDFVEGVPQTWWSEDTRDKEIILGLIVQGSCSTETRTHQIRLRHCFSSKAIHVDSKTTHRRNQRPLSCSSEEEFRNL